MLVSGQPPNLSMGEDRNLKLELTLVKNGLRFVAPVSRGSASIQTKATYDSSNLLLFFFFFFLDGVVRYLSDTLNS